MLEKKVLSFPDNFIWGAATSAYQIEGGWDLDGKGPSIWDTFCREPGKVFQAHTGDVAAAHYHHWREDVRIMSDLGLNAYRFSIAWPRILPTGKDVINPAGLDFYDRLVDALLERNIRPFVTLFHWDLPQVLQDEGGWTNRETARYFAEYARIVAERLGDRVKDWITHNEPMVVTLSGHFLGDHAPGIQDPFLAFRAGYHLMLSHGFALEALRAGLPRDARIGITLNLNPVHPASSFEEDLQAAHRIAVVINKFFLDPVLCGQFPLELQELFGPLFPNPDPEDLKLISAPLDFLGLNYYTRAVVKHDPAVPLIQASQVFPTGNEYSQMWEIYPSGIYELLAWVWLESAHRTGLRLIITENGVPVADAPDFDGEIRDYRRIHYLRDHLVQIHKAVADGIPISGYFVWSLLDNFEWAHGYRMRFGLAYIDFETLSRTIKLSGRWYAKVIHQNGLDLPGDEAFFLS